MSSASFNTVNFSVNHIVYYEYNVEQKYTLIHSQARIPKQKNIYIYPSLRYNLQILNLSNFISGSSYHTALRVVTLAFIYVHVYFDIQYISNLMPKYNLYYIGQYKLMIVSGKLFLFVTLKIAMVVKSRMFRNNVFA